MVSLKFLALLLYVNVVACIAAKQAIYLVLMEGEPAAFHRSSPPREDARTFNQNRFGSKTCFAMNGCKEYPSLI